MSVLTTIWRHLTQQSNTKKKTTVAILAAADTPTMSHYIERLSAYIQVMSPQDVTIKIYRNILDPAEENELVADHEKQNFQGFLAMDGQAGQALLRIKHHVVLEAPAIILGYKELLPKHMPKNVAGFFFPDASVETFQTIRKVSPQCNKVLIMGKRRVLDSVNAMVNLAGHFENARVKVSKIYLDEANLSLEDQFAMHAPGASLVYTAFDLGVFEHIEEIVTIAHRYGLLVTASNLFSIHFGADIVVGFPETKVFRYIAHRFVLLMGGVASDSTVFNVPMELHCNAHQLNKYPYVMSNIGALMDSADIGVHVHANKQAAR